MRAEQADRDRLTVVIADDHTVVRQGLRLPIDAEPVERPHLRHLRAKLRNRLRKRAAEDAAIRNAITEVDLDPYGQAQVLAGRTDQNFDEDDWKRRNRRRFIRKYMADEYARTFRPHKLPAGGGSCQEVGPLLVRNP
jgi:hypothetical protein